MKVRVCYTVDVTDDYRRAIRNRFGQTGKATRSEVAEFLRQNGGSLDDDLMFEYRDGHSSLSNSERNHGQRL